MGDDRLCYCSVIGYDHLATVAAEKSCFVLSRSRCFPPACSLLLSLTPFLLLTAFCCFLFCYEPEGLYNEQGCDPGPDERIFQYFFRLRTHFYVASSFFFRVIDTGILPIIVYILLKFVTIFCAIAFFCLFAFLPFCLFVNLVRVIRSFYLNYLCVHCWCWFVFLLVFAVFPRFKRLRGWVLPYQCDLCPGVRGVLTFRAQKKRGAR